MSIQLYNTLSRKKETFTPLSQGQVSMYHCGPTVYDYAHIGNLRHYVFADVLRKMFEYNEYTVSQVINITDVGHLVGDADEGADKIEEASQKQGKTAEEITSFYTKAFLEDLKELNIETKGTQFPRATQYIEAQIALIKILEEKGFTYTTRDGVYFDTSKKPNYGAFAGISYEKGEEEARIASNPEKRNSADFALWKFSPQNISRQQEWDSPWGTGFPGWHLECSAMAMECLGETLDVHTSGIDHIPTHHTNEIAQSEGATGKPFVRYWLHNEHVLINGKKMAKSLGNIITLKELIEKKHTPLAYRYFLLSAHYRSLINFTWEALSGAQHSLLKLYEHYLVLDDTPSKESEKAQEYKKMFKEYISDDLDTPRALALLWKVVKDEELPEGDKKKLLDEYDAVLGLGLCKLKKEPLPGHIEALADERAGARANKDWEKADALRLQIEKEGYLVKDAQEGQKIIKNYNAGL